MITGKWSDPIRGPVFRSATNGMIKMISRMDSGYYTVKLCIMGDGGVGKTTLIERLSTGRFNPITKMTIGIDFSLIHHIVSTKSGEQIPFLSGTVHNLKSPPE